MCPTDDSPNREEPITPEAVSLRQRINENIVQVATAESAADFVRDTAAREVARYDMSASGKVRRLPPPEGFFDRVLRQVNEELDNEITGARTSEVYRPQGNECVVKILPPALMQDRVTGKILPMPTQFEQADATFFDPRLGMRKLPPEIQDGNTPLFVLYQLLVAKVQAVKAAVWSPRQDRVVERLPLVFPLLSLIPGNDMAQVHDEPEAEAPTGHTLQQWVEIFLGDSPDIWLRWEGWMGNKDIRRLVRQVHVSLVDTLLELGDRTWSPLWSDKPFDMTTPTFFAIDMVSRLALLPKPVQEGQTWGELLQDGQSSRYLIPPLRALFDTDMRKGLDPAIAIALEHDQRMTKLLGRSRHNPFLRYSEFHPLERLRGVNLTSAGIDEPFDKDYAAEDAERTSDYAAAMAHALCPTCISTPIQDGVTDARHRDLRENVPRETYFGWDCVEPTPRLDPNLVFKIEG